MLNIVKYKLFTLAIVEKYKIICIHSMKLKVEEIMTNEKEFCASDYTWIWLLTVDEHGFHTETMANANWQQLYP